MFPREPGPASPAGMPLRIAVVAPPWFELPPTGYGGIEWMCYWLVEGLVAAGHEVLVVGAGRRHTAARFVATYEEPQGERLGDPIPDVVHTARSMTPVDSFAPDVIHDHTLAGPLTALARSVPTVITAHGPVDGELGDYYRALGERIRLVAISSNQRSKDPTLPWLGTVHNAIPVREYPYQPEKKEDFALFLGRMSPEKAPHLAVEVARRAGMPLVIAAKCNEKPEHRYAEEYVKPLLHSPGNGSAGAEWIGEADTATKKDLLARARCLIFPIQWDEPFGIVMIEAMACGTPVVALRAGSVPEVVDHGSTGFICDTLDEMVAATQRVGEIDPATCRRHALTHFDVARMVEGYELVYRRAITEHAMADHETLTLPNLITEAPALP